MKPVRRAILGVSLLFMAGAVCSCAEARAQDASADGTKPVTASGPPKPVHKLNQVPTTDPVVQLGAKREAAKDGVATAPAGSRNPEVTAAADPAEDTQRKAAEIASIEKQIEDKITRITLLMRLFVTDEKAFVIDPSNPQGDASAKEQRKYAQDELRWETAELAKLKARLNAITAAR